MSFLAAATIIQLMAQLEVALQFALYCTLWHNVNFVVSSYSVIMLVHIWLCLTQNYVHTLHIFPLSPDYLLN